jgi:Family of unknown function (DUF6152)
MKKLLASLAVAGATFVTAEAAYAHHSFAAFDNREEAELTLEGTATKFLWINPHALMEVAVKDKAGKNVKWVLEGPSSAYMARKGFTKTSIKPGDKVRFTVAPLKDGRPGGVFTQVLTVNGKKMGEFDPNPGRNEAPTPAPGAPARANP